MAIDKKIEEIEIENDLNAIAILEKTLETVKELIRKLKKYIEKS